ncbi:aminotransferase class V-fold PLP-dependent enzyme [Oxalobacteraceae bacterium]|nr:aminotransferase class V-fold PLP-dependent enzyme [Oxalobacteraceae bacterium]
MKTLLSRRRYLQGLGALAGAGLPSLMRAAEPAATVRGTALSLALPALRPGVPVASDERYWDAVAAQYSTTRELVNLENGYYGIMAQPVLVQYQCNVAYLNEHNSIYLRQGFDADVARTRARIAAVLGVQTEEIALTRGATEALQNLISNYRGLKPGDTVMYADLDYGSAQEVFDYLQERRGVKVARIVLPEPASRQGVLDTYAQALERHPGTRLLLLTHVNNKTGLVLPLAELAQLARSRGVDVIVDAAHSFGQIDFQLPQLGVDFAAFNLHKWIGAPLGVGFMYIRRERLKDIAPHLIGASAEEDDIGSRVHSGTGNTANVMTVVAALDFQQAIGIANKAARLRYLRDYWVSRVRGVPGVQVLTPDEPGMAGAITAFRLNGQTSKDANLAIAARLRTEYGIFTVQRGGVARGDCVRVTPALFTRTSDLHRLVAALRAIGRV